MNSLQMIQSLLIWLAAQLWGPDPATVMEPLPSLSWGTCYNEAYRANHPGQVRVEGPLVAFTQGVMVRPEVWTCRDEFEQWLQSRRLSGYGSRYELQVSRALEVAFARARREGPPRSWGQLPRWTGAVAMSP